MKDIILALIGNDKALVTVIIGVIVVLGVVLVTCLLKADPTNIISTAIAALAAFVTGVAVGKAQ